MKSLHPRSYVASVIMIGVAIASCGSGSPKTTLQIHGAYAESFDFESLKSRAEAILVVSGTEKYGTEVPAGDSVPQTVTYVHVEQIVGGTKPPIDTDIWVRQVGTSSTSMVGSILRDRQQYLLFVERYLGPALAKGTEEWVILGADQGLYDEVKSGEFARIGAERPLSNPVSISLINGELSAVTTRSLGDTLCVDLQRIFEAPVSENGGSLVKDLRTLDLSFLDTDRQHAFKVAVDSLEGQIAQFQAGKADGWSTAALSAALSRDCSIDIPSQNVSA